MLHGLGGNGPQVSVAMISCLLYGIPSLEGMLVPIAQMRTQAQNEEVTGLKLLVTQSCPTLLRPRGLQPAWLYPWNSPGKNTGVGCHFLLLPRSHGGSERVSAREWVPFPLQGSFPKPWWPSHSEGQERLWISMKQKWNVHTHKWIVIHDT